MPLPKLSPKDAEELLSSLIERAAENGNSHRGLMVFTSAKSACLSCHRVRGHGGTVGPELTDIGKDRKPHELVESVVWPQRTVAPEYVSHLIVDADGKSHQGYLVRKDEHRMVIRDPTQPASGEQVFQLEDIDEHRRIGTLMPDNLTATMTAQQLDDLLQFIFTLGTNEGMPAAEMDSLLEHAQAHMHPPATFSWERRPIRVEHWPSWQHHVNRHRVYDFYAKQAEHFRPQPNSLLLAEFPGLDGGELGHWGNQNEEVWASDRWNDTKLGSVQCGIFRGAGKTVPRGICVQVDDDHKLYACFNPDTLTYDAIWTGQIAKFSSVRNGFLGGVEIGGQPLAHHSEPAPQGAFQYHGFYRHGNRVAFSYRVGGTEFLDVPRVIDGRFSRSVAPVEQHPLKHLLKNAPRQWPEVIETPIHFGAGSPYAVDTVELPFQNPWNALLFCGGHDFLPDGSAFICTMQGDVWHVSGFEYPSRTATWRRFASGLHHALGIVVDDDGIFVLGRDQITRLHDLNNDGEADFYECFNNGYETSPAGHDFICGLERDSTGNFYTASGNQGLVRISADGKRADVVATGFRNPDGLAVLPDGTVTVPCSEGEWTPASMICAVPPVQPQQQPTVPIPHFGYRGPREGRVPQLPLAYLPRGLDNSSGGQAIVTSDRWGPMRGQLLHFSFGMGAHFLVLRDEVDGQQQGAVVPLPGEFRSGAHRGRFSHSDGQLYVSGMQGWGSYTPDEGCFHRVRFTGETVQQPIGFHLHENGVAVTFSEPLDVGTVSDPGSHFAQVWSYRYGPGYGSPEFSTHHDGVRGHDRLTIAGAHILSDQRTLFLQLPDLQPVNQLHLHLQSAPDVFHDLFVTVHKLGQPYVSLPNYQHRKKSIEPHPIVADLARATQSVENPHRHHIEGARAITIESGSNLTFATRSIRVRSGEPIALTFSNPDVVPHNWVLVDKGALERVGNSANQLISDTNAALKHYIPQSDDVLAYSDIVLPRENFTIYFHAPVESGRYPYLCTFPGHWKVMNGEMIVESAAR